MTERYAGFSLTHPSWRPWVRDVNVLAYCLCAHAEQNHRPTCTVSRCICDAFTEAKRQNVGPT